MAYADVDAGLLINSIKLCKSSLNTKSASALLTDAKAIPWDGAGAQENLVAAISKIQSQTSKLSSELDSCLDIANKIKEYKKLERKIKKLNAEKDSLKARYEKDPTAPTAGYVQNAYMNKKRVIAGEQKNLEALGNSLSSAGFPPV